jgi:ATP-binding cassette, subfamily B, bacterial PglK
MSTSFIQNIKGVEAVLTPKDKKKAYSLFLLSFFSSVFDTLGVALVIPLVNILSDFEFLLTFSVINTLYNLTSFSITQFNLLAIILIAIYFTVSTIFKAIVNYKTRKFIITREVSISSRLVDIYLSKEYLWIVKSNPSVLVKRVLSEVNHIIAAGLVPLGGVVNSLLLIVSISIFLLWVNFFATVVIFSVLIIFYSFVLVIAKPHLKKAGVERSKAIENKYKLTNEIFSGFKSIKIDHLESIYSNLNKVYTLNFTNAQVKAFAISSIPRFAIELLLFISVISFVFYVVYANIDATILAPTFAVFVVSAVKLLPAIQQLYGSISGLSFAYESVKEISDELKSPSKSKDFSNNCNNIGKFHSCSVKNLNFSYNEKNIINDFNLNILQGDKIAVIGPSGCGKSTLIELLLGLIKPKSGEFVLNNTLATAPMYADFRVAYVPQNIFLYNDTIENNIVFFREYDEAKLDHVAKITGVDKAFNVHNSDKCLKTNIGEGGLRISGGQRQRIGIARAMYGNPEILILDESTSAIDEKNESMIIDNLLLLGNDLTLLFITHNSSIILDFDKVIEL